MSKAKTSACFICKSKQDDELLYGRFYEKWRIRVHYYCLLLTSNLVQNGETDEEGIFGFLQEDITSEEARISSQKCYVCKEKYANISCCAKKCFRTFHTVCGKQNGCLSHFIDTYQSWCDKHVELYDKTKHEETDACGICYDDMGPYNKLESILAPCCQNGWFHRRCVAQFAQTAGYFFKCPLCNNKDEFTHAIQLRGVFVPEKDAAWELEPNAFNEQLERPSVCDAEICLCRYGREYDNINKWDLILCATCGSTCRHDLCMEEPSKNYVCAFCRPIVGDEPPPAVLALAEAAKRAEAEKQAAANRLMEDISNDSTDNCPSSSSSVIASGSRKSRTKHRNRLQSAESSSSNDYDNLNTGSGSHKKRRISSTETSSGSLVTTSKKRKSKHKRCLSSASSRSSSGSRRFNLQDLVTKIKLPVDSAKKLLNSNAVVKIKKLTDQQIKDMTSSENEDGSSTTSSVLFDFNYRVKLNKKQRRKSISDLRSIKEVIRSDTDTLTDASGGKEAMQNKTPSSKGFAKQFKLKLFVSKTTSRKRLGSTSESEYADCDVPIKKPYFSPDKLQNRSRVSLFPSNDEENTCPNSPMKGSVEPLTVDNHPSPAKVLGSSQTPLKLKLDSPKAISKDVTAKAAPQQRTLNSFFIKSASTDDTSSGQHSASNGSAISSTSNSGSGSKTTKRSATKTPGGARKKFVELDRGQRNLLDYFNRC